MTPGGATQCGQSRIRGESVALERKIVLEEETAVFILVNFADIVLTAYTFSYGGWEVNALAAWIIRRFGIVGLAFYKFALVTFVVLVCQFIYSSHPKTARWLLIAGSICYGLLAAYETVQLIRHVFSTL